MVHGQGRRVRASEQRELLASGWSRRIGDRERDEGVSYQTEKGEDRAALVRWDWRSREVGAGSYGRRRGRAWLVRETEKGVMIFGEEMSKDFCGFDAAGTNSYEDERLRLCYACEEDDREFYAGWSRTGEARPSKEEQELRGTCNYVGRALTVRQRKQRGMLCVQPKAMRGIEGVLFAWFCRMELSLGERGCASSTVEEEERRRRRGRREEKGVTCANGRDDVGFFVSLREREREATREKAPVRKMNTVGELQLRPVARDDGRTSETK